MTRQSLLILVTLCGLAVASYCLWFDADDSLPKTGWLNAGVDQEKRGDHSPAPLQIAVSFLGREGSNYYVACTARNITATRLDFWVWTCSRYDNWLTDNNAVTIEMWECRGNFPEHGVASGPGK